MADLSYSTTPTAGTTNNASDVTTPLNEIEAYVNGSGWVDATRLASSAVTTAKINDDAVTGAKLDATAIGDSDQGDELGVNGASTVRRGKCAVSTAESTTSTSYTTLSTPDRVQNVVLPTDGLIFVAYRALWKGGPNCRAAIFLGSNQLKVNGIDGTAPVTQAAAPENTSSTGYYQPITSCPMGLVAGLADQDNSGFVTTGQALGMVDNVSYFGAEINGSYLEFTQSLGGACVIEAAAGTYDISVQYKISSGTVTAKDRKLWVWTMGF